MGEPNFFDSHTEKDAYLAATSYMAGLCPVAPLLSILLNAVLVGTASIRYRNPIPRRPPCWSS